MIVLLLCCVCSFLLAANDTGNNVTGVIVEKGTGKPIDESM